MIICVERMYHRRVTIGVFERQICTSRYKHVAYATMFVASRLVQSGLAPKLTILNFRFKFKTKSHL